MDTNWIFHRIFNHASMDGFQYLCRLHALQGLSQQDICRAVDEACSFFGMPFPNVIDTTNHPTYRTMFASLDPRSYRDDIICYDLRELAALNVGSYNALTLVLTHEATHRRTQSYSFPGPNHGAHAMECISDWYMGVRAGLCRMGDIKHVAQGLGNTDGSDTHPAGYIRKMFIDNGVSTGLLNRSNTRPNFEFFLPMFKDFYETMRPSLEHNYAKHYSLLQRMTCNKTFGF